MLIVSLTYEMGFPSLSFREQPENSKRAKGLEVIITLKLFQAFESDVGRCRRYFDIVSGAEMLGNTQVSTH